MDGIKDNQTNDSGSSVMTTTGRKGRFASLMLLAAVVGGLHFVLFNALDTVAPLGTDNVDSKLIVIDADSSLKPTFFESRAFDQLVADAR